MVSTQFLRLLRAELQDDDERVGEMRSDGDRCLKANVLPLVVDYAGRLRDPGGLGAPKANVLPSVVDYAGGAASSLNDI